MKKQGRQYRISMRMWSREATRMRRFGRAIDRMDRSAASQAPHMLSTPGFWEHFADLGYGGLIHKGGKP
jgi:hypothetical protein